MPSRLTVASVVCVSCVFAVVACSGGDEATPTSGVEPTTSDTVRRGTPEAPVPASSLAASQVSAATVPRPSVPPRCSPDDVAVWTAQVRPYAEGVDAALRVANVGGDWCEVDLSGSPRLDPGIEPDVWLEAGEWAELVIGPSGEGCLETDVVTLAQMTIGGETVVVPTTAITPCGWSFSALFPLDPPVDACTDLDVAATAAWLVVRHAGPSACVLADLTSVGDVGVTPRRPAAPPVTALEPGDLAGYPLRPADDGADCSDEPVALTFADGSVQSDVVIGPCVLVELGPARSVLAGSSGLMGDLDRTAQLDVPALVALLDPFGSP